MILRVGTCEAVVLGFGPVVRIDDSAALEVLLELVNAHIEEAFGVRRRVLLLDYERELFLDLQ